VIEMFWLYKGVFLLVLLAGLVMPLVGSHLPARNQVVRSLMVTQMATLGLLLGMLVASFFHLPHWLGEVVLPLAFAVIVTFILLRLIEKAFVHLNEGSYMCGYFIFLAMSFIVCSLFPGLELHHTQMFFGDVVTISGVSLWGSILFMLLALVLLLKYQKDWILHSVDQQLLGDCYTCTKTHDRFAFFSLMTIIIGLFSLGQMFTLGAMLIAPIFLKQQAFGLSSFLKLIAVLTSTAMVSGLSLSLVWTKLSTVPLMILILVIFCLIWSQIYRFSTR
jgi:ABC-type Mn2+/Zn2+ transport system permease subunit